MGSGVGPQEQVIDAVNFQVTVGTSSTLVTTNNYRSKRPVRVCFKGHPDNTGIVYVGNRFWGKAYARRTITTGTGWPLAAGQDITFECNDPRIYAAIASAADQVLCVEVGFAGPVNSSTTST